MPKSTDQSPANLGVLKTLKASIDKIRGKTGIVDPSNNIDADLNKITASINNILKSNRGSTGEDVTMLINKSLYASDKKKKNKTEYEKNLKSTVSKINELTNTSQFSGMINDVFYSERPQVLLYNEYEKLISVIPEVSIIVDTYIENIISPESFDSKQIMYSYNDNSNPDFSAFMQQKIGQIIEVHKLEEEIRKVICDRVSCGHGYFAVINYNDFINQMLKESNDDSSFTQPEYESNPFTIKESSRFDSSDFNFDKILTESGDTELDYITENNCKELIELFNLQYKLHESEATLLEDTSEPVAKINKLTPEQVFKNISDLGANMFNIKSTSEFVDSKRAGDKNKNTKIDELGVSGTIVFKLDPRNLVPIETDNNVCLGYYYIDHDNSKVFGQYSTKERGFNPTIYSDVIANNGISSMSNEQLIDAKTKLISELFATGIAKKLNKQFVKDNPQFKEIIFGILKNKQKASKVYNITYLPPESVVMFGDKDSQSILKNILFVGKLYIACLLSNFMQRITQGSEKRLIYVDVGLDTDIPGAMNSFAKSLKSKDFKMSNLDDISTVFNRISTNQDIFVPTIDGNKPIDVEMMPNREISYQDDFLTLLKEMMFIGSGLPSELLAGTNQVDFAQSLSMRTARFLRRIIPMQNQANRGLKNTVVAVINSDEKYTDVNNTDEESKKFDIKANFDPKYLTVSFAKPLSMMSQMYSDKIGTFTTFADFIAKTVTNIADETDPIYSAFKQSVVAEYMNEIDWKKFEDLLNTIKEQSKMEKITTSGSQGGSGEDPAAAGGDDLGNY